MKLGGLTQLEFETLWAIVDGRPWSPETHALEWVGEPPEGDAESWLFRFPPVYVALLAKLAAADLPAIAAEWAQTEEIACAPEEIAPVVQSLVDLARSAATSSRGLYLWGSL